MRYRVSIRLIELEICANLAGRWASEYAGAVLAAGAATVFAWSVAPGALLFIVPVAFLWIRSLIRWIAGWIFNRHTHSFEEDVARHPRLQELWRGVCTDFALDGPPPSVHVNVLPVHIRKEPGEVILSLACLAVWSVHDLACHIAHSSVRRAYPRFFSEANAALVRPRRGSPAPRSEESGRRAARYYYLADEWHTLADMEADSRVASKYGARAVENWASSTAHVSQSPVEEIVDRAFEAAQRYRLFAPIATACRARYRSKIEAWNEFVDSSIRQLGDGKGGAGPPRRIAALRKMAGDPCPSDPAIALDLFDDIAGFEERVMRSAARIGPDIELVRVSEDGSGPVALPPDQREEVQRNAGILEGKSWRDLPDLVKSSEALAPHYREEPGDLYSLDQRRIAMSSLLTGFLAMELESLGWQPRFSLENGFFMAYEGGRLEPAEVVKKLFEGETAAEDYAKLIG